MQLFKTAAILFCILLPGAGLAMPQLPDFSGARVIGRVQDIPAAVVSVSMGPKAANPGEEWQTSDAIPYDKPRLPGQRLIWALGANDAYMVHYERGGLWYRSNVAVIRLRPDGSAQEIWQGNISSRRKLKDYADFQQEMTRGGIEMPSHYKNN